MEKLNEDFIEFIQLLEKNNVQYMIVGGYAVAFYGFPRYTGDIDFFVNCNQANAEKLQSVLNQFGFSELEISIDDFLKKDYVVEIGREPRKIQVLTGVSGVTFDQCFPNIVEHKESNLALKFIGKSDLIKNKQATGRPKDLIDIQELSN